MALNVLQDVVAARHVGGRHVWLRFEDGTQGEIDLADVIPNPRGLLVQLMNPAFVAQVRVDPLWKAGTPGRPLSNCCGKCK